MWIFTIYGFFSVAVMKNRKGKPVPWMVMVRSRSRRHLLNLQRRFPVLRDRKIETWMARDYGYRLIVPKTTWADCLRALALEQDWSNFKEAAAVKSRGRDEDYTGALHAVWATMLELQEGKNWWKGLHEDREGDGAVVGQSYLDAAAPDAGGVGRPDAAEGSGAAVADPV